MSHPTEPSSTPPPSSSPSSPPPPPPGPVPATGRLSAPPAAPPRRGCASRLLGFVGWLLTLALSAALGIAALAAIAYFVFGFTLATPAQIRQSSADVATLQGQARTLSTEVARASTAEAEARRELSSANERLGDLEGRLAGLEQQAAELAGQSATAAALAGELRENVAVAATIQAEGRDSQVLVSVVATVQADNTTRLAELQRRTERISRFLTRLGDLAGDVGAEDTPLPPPTPAPEENPPASTPEPAGPTPPPPPQGARGACHAGQGDRDRMKTVRRRPRSLTRNRGRYTMISSFLPWPVPEQLMRRGASFRVAKGGARCRSRQSPPRPSPTGRRWLCRPSSARSTEA